jgi:hypothetical protein
MNGITYDKLLNKENLLFLTILNYFRQIFGSTQLFCTIRLADHGTQPGTSIQCKTKGSSCHRGNGQSKKEKMINSGLKKKLHRKLQRLSSTNHT